MNKNSLSSLSPLDGRYAGKMGALAPLFSESGLIRHRLEVEIEWFKLLANAADIKEVPSLSAEALACVDATVRDFGQAEAERVKTLEGEINHDVKAVEYYLAERFKSSKELAPLTPFLHFACTSEDINNLAYALMVKKGRDEVLVPLIGQIIGNLTAMAHRHAGVPMLSRTHGQPATPTTLGKELANFVYRLRHALAALQRVPVLGKLNGAVGNFNAHVVAYPEVDWQSLSDALIRKLGLESNPLTTQIEPHDWMAELFDALRRLNVIAIDLSRDIWGYISLGYFRQQPRRGEVGSSTMPHKINPIDFENAEGNLGLANALLSHLADKLPISRWQRDLSDSTVLRSVGSAFGHALLAFDAMQRGLQRIEVDEVRLAADLEANWDVLAEAVQTVMRRHGHADAYERLKELTRGRRVDQSSLRNFIAGLPLPGRAKQQLMDLTPAAYIGLAARLAKAV
jgi:adenylosuccinate lyase